MVTDARSVFTEIDATEIEDNVVSIPISEDESVDVERQNLSGVTVEQVESRDRSLAESTLLDANTESGQVTDGATVDTGGRRLLVDTQRVGYAVVWKDLTLESNGTISKEVGYVVTDPTAIR